MEHATQGEYKLYFEFFYLIIVCTVYTNDLSIGSTETKYIKLNTETQNIFCFVNENLTTFLYTLTGGTRKQKEKKSFLF